ncbi:hypothetical protein [Arthrobacter sp. NA-172]|uniref:hypothetical protein n=1 Tax=Arthrobacter sp. NA-172 TaxID=3367524 RepID=UPI0037552612
MPAPAPLATPAQLGNFLQQTIADTDPVALQLLAEASAVIRRYLDQTVTVVTGDVELCTPLSGKVFLSQWPVNAVSLVEIYDWQSGAWSTVSASAYRPLLSRGMIKPNPYAFVQWPCGEDSWRVTYDHGYVTVPDDIQGVAVSMAARFYATPTGVDMERTGMRQIKYSLTADDLNAIERITLDGIRFARIA